MTRWIARGAGGLLLIILAGAVAADGLLATEVLPIAPKPPEVVQVERGLWETGDPVPPIYGIPAARPQRILLVDTQRLIRPQEDPRLVLLAVDKQRGDNPLQVKTMWFFVTRVALGLSLVFLAAVLMLLWQRRRGAPRAAGGISLP